MTMTRVRFAPSPTGELHVGNARTALFNWLFARKHQGVMVLRIEDTDRDRSSTLFEEHLMADLRWLGLEWDEGPDRGGAYGPYRQSERLPLYERYQRQLEAQGLIYPCFCTEEELEEERALLLARRLTPRYMGKCRNLSPQEREQLEAQGRMPAWRFKVPPGAIHFQDLIRGPMQFLGETIGDFIIIRKNGTPAYNFACVVDDHLMGISHVIRGEDHLTNTASQILLYRALDFDIPLFAHHALILGRDRAKLSKRHGAVTVEQYRSRGILPEAFVNYLALLGSSLAGDGEFCPPEELVERFSLEKAGKSGAIFDEDKLLWLNTLYLRRAPAETVARHLRAMTGTNDLDEERLRLVLEVVRGNISTLNDVLHYLQLLDDRTFTLSAEVQRILAAPEARNVIRQAVEEIRALDGNVEGRRLFSLVYGKLKEKTGRSAKEILMPLRLALTGESSGPELDRLFTFLGRESVLKRLTQVL